MASTMDITATLRSPAHAGLVLGDDPKYEMYHSSKYNKRFGTRYISPPTREEHGRREYFGAPYKFANDLGNSFESSRPDRSPSPELEDVPRVFLHRPLSKDSESDFSNPFGQWYWRQREEEERQDALLKKRQRAELLAVSRDPGHNPIAVPPPQRPQRPNEQIQGPNVVSLAPLNHDNPSIDRQAQGFLWHGIWHPPPIRGAIPTPDESDNENPRPQKKRRGRPPKEQKAAVVRNAPRGGALPSKRKLGKRKTNQVDALVFRDPEVGLDTVAVAQPVKRKRGRPRKNDRNGLNLVTPQSSTTVQNSGRTAAKRTIPETSRPPPQHPDTWEFGRRLGGGGKWKPGEAPGDKTTLPSHSEKEGAKNGPAVPSSSREKEGKVNNSAIVLSPMEGSSRDADVRAARDGKRKERSRSPDEEDDDVPLPSWNIFDENVLLKRATRSGREFAG